MLFGSICTNSAYLKLLLEFGWKSMRTLHLGPWALQSHLHKPKPCTCWLNLERLSEWFCLDYGYNGHVFVPADTTKPLSLNKRKAKTVIPGPTNPDSALHSLQKCNYTIQSNQVPIWMDQREIWDRSSSSSITCANWSKVQTKMTIHLPPFMIFFLHIEAHAWNCTLRPSSRSLCLSKTVTALCYL